MLNVYRQASQAPIADPLHSGAQVLHCQRSTVKLSGCLCCNLLHPAWTVCCKACTGCPHLLKVRGTS